MNNTNNNITSSLAKGAAWTLIVFLFSLVVKFTAYFLYVTHTPNKKLSDFPLSSDQYVEISFALASSILIDYWFCKHHFTKLLNGLMYSIFFFIFIFAFWIEYLKNYETISNTELLAQLSPFLLTGTIIYSVGYRARIFYYE